MSAAEQAAKVSAIVVGEDKLAALHEQFLAAKATADEAASRLDAIKAAIKVQLNGAHPEAHEVVLNTEGLPPLRLAYRETTRFDTRRFRAVEPVLYEEYVTTSGSWTLTSGGRS